jgi:threonine/homoserine/homoserine lactone efflux protein
MRHLWKIFFTGMLVSFLGSLPLGTLNVAAMQISVSDGITAAMLFSAGSLTAEIVYVRLSLVAMDWVRKQEKIFKILEWVTLVIVVALAISSFYAATHPSEQKNAILSQSTLPHFVLGLVMSAVNPVQIPFWFGLEHNLVYQKNIVATTGSLQHLYCRHRPGYFFRQLCFYFWRPVDR